MGTRRRRITQAFVVFGVAAALSSGGGVAFGHEWAATPTQIDFYYFEDPTGQDFFTGQLFTAEHRECDFYREVKVYRIRRGADQLIGSDVTDGGPSYGSYSVEKEAPRDGRYYLHVTKRINTADENHSHVCLAGRSPTIMLKDGQEV